MQTPTPDGSPVNDPQSVVVCYLATLDRWLVMLPPDCEDQEYARAVTVIPSSCYLRSHGTTKTGRDFLVFGD